MRPNPPPFDLAKVDAATAVLLAEGVRLFQTHFYAHDKEEHVRLLLRWMAPPMGAVVVDMGCGVGEVARLMRAARPDLEFVLVDLSRRKLDHCPTGEGFYRVLADAHATGLPGERADVVMFHSALINMDAQHALAEATRLLKPGGICFVNELIRKQGDNRRFEEVLGAWAPTEWELRNWAALAGLFCDGGPMVPPGLMEEFRARLEAIQEAALLDDVQPQVWRFTRRV
jgi:SAM-dependent methyltransferase